MPLLDKPLSELRTYTGTNPCPPDFEEYWARAIRELDATDPSPSLTPSNVLQSEEVECFDLHFTGVGGARVYAKYLRPCRREGAAPAVLSFHGYAGSSGNWVDHLAFAGRGFCVAAMDARGQGGLSEDVGGVSGTTMSGHIIRGLEGSPDKLLFRDIFLDTAQLARVVAAFDEVDANRMGAQGGSQGGALTLACASLYPGLRRAAPVYPFLCDYKRVWEMDLCKGAYEELNYYFRSFDPCHEREEEVWNKLGYIDLQFLAPRIRAEILMGTGLMDTICPPSTQFAAYNKIVSPKQVKIYPDFGHEGLPGFNDLVFNFLSQL